MSFIKNARNTPINSNSGTVPNMGDAILDWFQPLTFGLVTKTVENAQVVETQEQIKFMGVIQPLTDRMLMIKPEGERAWTWLWVHADPSLALDVDDVIIYNGKQTRVMTKKDYTLYGYIDYHMCQDYTGAGPAVAEENC